MRKQIKLEESAIEELKALQKTESYRGVTYSELIVTLIEHEKAEKADSDALLGDNERLLKINNTLEKEIEKLKEEKQRILESKPQVEAKKVEAEGKLKVSENQVTVAVVKADTEKYKADVDGAVRLACQAMKSASSEGKFKEMFGGSIADLQERLKFVFDPTERRRLEGQIEKAEQIAMQKGIAPRRA